jgi:hypothetical protein
MLSGFRPVRALRAAIAYGLLLAVAVAAFEALLAEVRLLTAPVQRAAHIVPSSAPLRLPTRAPADLAAAVEPPRTGRFQTLSEEWSNQLRSKEYWQERKNKAGGSRAAPPPQVQPSGLTRAPANAFSPAEPAPSIVAPKPSREAAAISGGNDTYFRTVCVRLCDGSFWPVSFQATRDDFERDSEACSRTCGGGARLFVHRNPGEEIDDMEDVEGRAYRRLPTAFAYRTTYNAQCRCEPQPWEAEALDRHRLYTLEARRAKGDKAVAGEIIELRKRVDIAASSRIAGLAPAQEPKGRKGRAAMKTPPPVSVVEAVDLPVLPVLTPPKQPRTVATRAVEPMTRTPGRSAIGNGRTLWWPAAQSRIGPAAMTPVLVREVRLLAPLLPAARRADAAEPAPATRAN